MIERGDMSRRTMATYKGDSNLATICTLIERGNLDRKSKLESTGRICHVMRVVVAMFWTMDRMY